MLYNENIASCTYLVYLLRVFHKRISPPLPPSPWPCRLTSVWPPYDLWATQRNRSRTVLQKHSPFVFCSFLLCLSCFPRDGFPVSVADFPVVWRRFPASNRPAFLFPGWLSSFLEDTFLEPLAAGKNFQVFYIFSPSLLYVRHRLVDMLIFPHKWWLSCVQESILYVQYVFVLR